MAADGSPGSSQIVSAPAAVGAPHSIEAEQALLGALLYDNETLNRLGDRLKPHHFYDPVHGRIFETISRIVISGRLADGVTLKEH